MLITRACIHARHALSVFTPDAIRLNVSSILASVPVGYLSVVLPIYFSRIGLDSQLIGQLYTLSSATSAILLVVFGVVADRVGRKPFVLAGTLLPMVSYLILLSTTDPLWLSIAAGIGGVGFANGLSGALMSSSFNALLAEKSDDAHRNAVFSLANAGWTGALMLGALMAGAPELLQRLLGMSVVDSYQPLFWLAMGLAIAGALLVLPIHEGHRRVVVAAPEQRASFRQLDLGRLAKLSLFMALIGLGLGFSIQLLPLWFFQRHGASGDTLGPWYALGNLLSTLFTLYSPRLARRVGAINAVFLTQGASALLLAGMVLAPAAWIAASLMVARAVTMNMSWPVQQSYMMGIVRPAERATVSSVTFTAWGLASAASPAISGLWLDQGLLALPLLAGGASYLLSAICLLLLFRGVKPPEEAALEALPVT